MSSAGGGGTGRASRLPRWTRQEILVLVEGKRVVERSGSGRGRGRGRGGGGEGDGAAAGAEPTKWAAVAEYCRRHGVDRGPMQCRKRWSNLAGDYKKVREWERSCSVPAAVKKTAEVSFWAMRNDARRERRLPGFFDREVYDMLEGRGGNAAAERLDLEAKQKEKAVVDGSRGVAAGEGGLFSSSEEEEDDEEEEAATPGTTPTPAPAAVAVPTSVEQAVPFFHETMCHEKNTEVPRQESSEQAGTSKRKQPEEITEDSPVQGGQQRQRSSDDASGRATTDLQGQLIEILDLSTQFVAAQLEAQNISSQLDREQRKDQVSSLLGVLGKVADALYKIADNL